MNNQKFKSNKAITLIALIITIVILLILAVVAIGAVQEDGIIGKAKYARDEYEKGKAKENSILQGYFDQLNDNTLYGSGGTGNAVDRVVITPDTTMEEAQDDNMLNKEVNSNVIDKYENPIIVPAGFKILVDDTTGYTADTIDVTKGIVIQDASGNEFVWVPVGNVYYSETEYKTINLDRYTFDSVGTPTPQGDAVIGSYCQELATSEYGNATAKDLQGFISSATTKGGYYLARYEAGVENGNLDTSDMIDEWTAPNSNWTGYVAEEGKELELASKKDVQVWNYVTQNKASELARGMYTSSNFTSDLVNSYAWDTAIVFIQTFGGCENYSKQNFSTSFANTGINNDKYCNIHDMSGNAYEMSTEAHSDAIYPCVSRGGSYGMDYGIPYDYASVRQNYLSNVSSIGSFRPLLHVAL